MRVNGGERTTQDGVTRVQARFEWEDSDRPPFSLFLEADANDADLLTADPNAFFLSGLFAAWYAGESRVAVDAPVCPKLLVGLKSAVATLRLWFPDLGPAPVVETPCTEVSPVGPAQALSLLSCGIDSLATLRWNRLHLPDGHPGAITASVPIVFEETPSTDGEAFAARVSLVRDVAQPVTADAGVRLVPVVTNIWWVADDGYFFDEKWHGALLASVAHAFSTGFRRAYLAPSNTTPELEPWGSHPLLDPIYSTAHLDIEHFGRDLTRFERTALVADWPAARASIRVCQRSPNWPGNCGTCEKCIRTMTALVALGRLADCPAFPADDVAPALIATIEEYDMVTANYFTVYNELVEPLREIGRDDLVDAIDTHVLGPMRRA